MSDYRGVLNYQGVGLQVDMHLLGHSNLIHCFSYNIRILKP